METAPAAPVEFDPDADPFNVPVAANADAAIPESFRNSRRVWSVLVRSVNVCSIKKGAAAEYYAEEGVCQTRCKLPADTAFRYITRNWRRQASRC
jgi:hypothetical protein